MQFQIKDVTRAVKKSLVASTLDEVRRKSAEKFDKIDLPNIHLDCDGTEIDDEDYFQTLEPNTELIAVFPGEDWIDVSRFFYSTMRAQSKIKEAEIFKHSMYKKKMSKVLMVFRHRHHHREIEKLQKKNLNSTCHCIAMIKNLHSSCTLK